MDIGSGRVFIARDVKFHLSTPYHQLLKTKPAMITLKPAEQNQDSEIEDEPPKPKFKVKPPKVIIESPKAMVEPPEEAALRRAINPIDQSDDDLVLPPQSPPPKPRRSIRNASNVSIATMIKQGPKTYHAALDAEEAEQWKEAISKEVASMESHEVFTFVEKVPEGASMLGSRWIMGRKPMANGTIETWKVRQVRHGDLQRLGVDNDFTSPRIDSAPVWFTLGLAA